MEWVITQILDITDPFLATTSYTFPLDAVVVIRSKAAPQAHHPVAHSVVGVGLLVAGQAAGMSQWRADVGWNWPNTVPGYGREDGTCVWNGFFCDIDATRE